MKEKVAAALLIIVMAVYLAICAYQGYKEWQEGITAEEQMREDALIW